MNFEKLIKERAEKDLNKLEKIKLWESRVEKLAKRKDDPIFEAEFCRRHDINAITFNRYKNLKAPRLPLDRFFNSVENAFKKENV